MLCNTIHPEFYTLCKEGIIFRVALSQLTALESEKQTLMRSRPLVVDFISNYIYSWVRILSANRFFALGDLTNTPKLVDITPSCLAKENKLFTAPTATRLELSGLTQDMTESLILA
ncbi:hypothetical protein [Nostoc sp.]|uniref:hypothetical protein n=1 Tax=Nostoc sp. TaxID=1180 RepID=UPI002FFBA7A5